MTVLCTKFIYHSTCDTMQKFASVHVRFECFKCCLKEIIIRKTFTKGEKTFKIDRKYVRLLLTTWTRMRIQDSLYKCKNEQKKTV